MSKKATKAWNLLHRLRREHGEDAAREKLQALRALEGDSLTHWEDVLAFHDTLCFLRAYPETPEILATAERILEGFAERKDLHRNREALEDTGIAGTALHSEFYWFSADWLSRRWPAQLGIDWEVFDDPSQLEGTLYPIFRESERLAYDGSTNSVRVILDTLRAPDETDATYLIRCLRGTAKALVLEHLYDEIGIPLRLAPAPGTPSRTHEKFPVTRVEYLTGPFEPPRGAVQERIQAAPTRVRRLSPRDGQRLYDLGRSAMLTRGRDLFAFIHADPKDTFIAEFGGGLAYACMGLVPERRHLLYGQYIVLVMNNGVPLGYIQACTLFNSTEVNFNIFDNFRDAEASRIFTSALALFRHLFGVDAFTINTQQLGEGNPEALKTGAWWFYYKHGFRPLSAELAPLVKREVQAKERDRGHRSSRATLEALSGANVYYFLGKSRSDVIGEIDLSHLGVAVAGRVQQAVGASGPRAVKLCADEAMRLLGVRSLDAWPRHERDSWKQWGPVVVALPDLSRWTPAEKRALVKVIRKKGGRREIEYIIALREHPRLQRGLLRLAKETVLDRPARR